MSYIDPATRQHVDTKAVTLFASAARAAAANGEWFDVGESHTLRLNLDITAAGGTDPTLDVTVQTRRDANDTARTLGTFTQAVDATGDQRKCFSALDRQVRAITALGGTDTPTFTFSLSGELVGY